MKRAGMILGIIGGAIGILIVLFFGLICTLETVAIDNGLQTDFKVTLYRPDQSDIEDVSPSDDPSEDAAPTLAPTQPKLITEGFEGNTGIFLFPLILLSAVLIGSGLGLAGAIVSRKKAVTGGVLMITGAVLSLTDIIGFILLFLGGIFVLIPEKQYVDNIKA